MLSPLPDASALEAGILEDPRPSRLSRVQENVRNLLRNSVIATIRDTPPATPMNATTRMANGLPTPPDSPHHPGPVTTAFGRDLSSPLDHTDQLTSETNRLPSTLANAAQNPPRLRFQAGPSLPAVGTVAEQSQTGPQPTHESAMFNTRALAALDHPDLSDPSIAVFLRNKTQQRQRRAWKRSRKSHRYSVARTSSRVLCVLSGLLLAATVATYVILASNTDNITPTFHILFVLGILLATIVFAHSMTRLCMLDGTSTRRKLLVIPLYKQRQHRRRINRQGALGSTRSERGEIPRLPFACDETAEFLPATPIRVHTDDDIDAVRPDSREAQPSVAVQQPGEVWSGEGGPAVARPPPAYGRWRNSVRANPDFLHWQAVPSPVESDVPALPSPTYEEAMATTQRTGPPSYMTRDSPARRQGGADGTAATAAGGERKAEIPEEEPEMVEVRGGAGLAAP